MASTLFIVLFVLYVSVDLGWAKTEVTSKRTCDQLPKVPFPRYETWSANGPLVFEWTLTSIFDCSVLIMSNRERGSKDSHGLGVVIRGDRATTFHYTPSSDRKLLSIVDSLGRNLSWYSMDAHDEGGFHCSYVCDGPGLLEFQCDTNNYNEFKQRMEDSVALARQVPNGKKIHSARKNCPELKHILF